MKIGRISLTKYRIKSGPHARTVCACCCEEIKTGESCIRSDALGENVHRYHPECLTAFAAHLQEFLEEKPKK
ncbi:MAG: hypothetical protein JXM72_12780 [Deltaproteobacteria bacterium]|nr:hypothetical protein [Deltaproteobacteria bacterium]